MIQLVYSSDNNVLWTGSGATLGPEAALSNVGGGLASYITDHWVHFEDDSDRKLVVLTGARTRSMLH